jgi:hypothetical protein
MQVLVYLAVDVELQWRGCGSFSKRLDDDVGGRPEALDGRYEKPLGNSLIEP